MKRYLYLILCAILTFGSIVYFENKVCAIEIAMVALYGSGEVAFISIEEAKVLKTVELDAPMPIRIAVTPDGKNSRRLL